MVALRLMYALAVLAAPLFGDGGAVLSRQESGPFVITVFAPLPIRAGPVDVTVLVQTRSALEPVLDANVSILLDGVTQIATRSQAQNKLLYAATLNLPHPGEWNYTVCVKSSAAQVVHATFSRVSSIPKTNAAEAACTVAISGSFQAAEPAPPLAAYTFYLAIPPVLIAIFILHQWLSRRSAPRRIAS
jgi:hypothetical protein